MDALKKNLISFFYVSRPNEQWKFNYNCYNVNNILTFYTASNIYESSLGILYNLHNSTFVILYFLIFFIYIMLIDNKC